MLALISRLKQPSTYAGLGGMAILLGMEPETAVQIGAAVAGVFAFVAAIVLPEQK